MLFPAMLFGLFGLSLPIVIHLLQRQRLRPQQLATLRFLDREDLANAFAPVPRDAWQLLLRLVLLTLFVVLMTRLTTSGPDTGPRTLAVVLDQSMSMRQLVGENESLFDRSQRQLLELIDGLRDGDRMSLTLVGDEVTQSTGLLRDRSELRAIAEQFAVSDSGSRGVVSAVERARDQLRSRHAVKRRAATLRDPRRTKTGREPEPGPRDVFARSGIRRLQ